VFWRYRLILLLQQEVFAKDPVKGRVPIVLLIRAITRRFSWAKYIVYCCIAKNRSVKRKLLWPRSSHILLSKKGYSSRSAFSISAQVSMIHALILERKCLKNIFCLMVKLFRRSSELNGVKHTFGPISSLEERT